MTEINRTEYGKYGACVEITDGVRSMLVTTDIGPRVIFFGMKGGANIMFEDKNDDINKSGEFFDKNLPGKGGWHIYGGHRLWKSPSIWTPIIPTTLPLRWKRSPTARYSRPSRSLTTKLRKSVKITMADDGTVTLEHKITNTGKEKTGKIALWALTVMDKGAKGEFRLSSADTGFLPNRNLVFWPYSDLTDDRFFTDGKRLRSTGRTDLRSNSAHASTTANW